MSLEEKPAPQKTEPTKPTEPQSPPPTTPEAKPPEPKKEGLTQDQIQTITKDAQKSTHQEVTEIVRYPGLKLVSKFSKMAAIGILAFFILLAFLELFIAEGWGDKIFLFFSCLVLALFFWMIFYLLGDFFQILVDIEENTRKRRKESNEQRATNN